MKSRLFLPVLTLGYGVSGAFVCYKTLESIKYKQEIISLKDKLNQQKAHNNKLNKDIFNFLTSSNRKLAPLTEVEIKDGLASNFTKDEKESNSKFHASIPITTEAIANDFEQKLVKQFADKYGREIDFNIKKYLKQTWGVWNTHPIFIKMMADDKELKEKVAEQSKRRSFAIGKWMMEENLMRPFDDEDFTDFRPYTKEESIVTAERCQKILNKVEQAQTDVKLVGLIGLFEYKGVRTAKMISNPETSTTQNINSNKI